MNDRLARIAAIVRADFVIRFRRLSTLVVFLLLSAFAYVWIPDPASGRALLQLQGRRALYNSAAVGMATASLAMIFVGLFGFYVISNAIRRDVVTRCGSVAASTPMRSTEYLLGKVMGNIAFLVTFVGGFALVSMAMVIVRGEASLEPLVFLKQYVLLTSSAIVFVAVVAVLFEATPFLSGKFGDVAYFFLWVSTLGGVTVGADKSSMPMLARSFDFSGFAFMIDRLHGAFGDHVSIGSSPFDVHKAPIVFNGLTMSPDWIVPRIASLVMPLLLLIPARLFFHRFDPVRTRRVTAKGQRNVLARMQMMFKPVTRKVMALLMPRQGNGATLVASAWIDGLMSITLMPATIVATTGFAIASLVAPTESFYRGVLPIAFAVFAVFASDVATRDGRAGTSLLIFSAPRLREQFVPWKFLSTLFFALLFFAVPLLRSASSGRVVGLAIALLFVSAAATALGVVTSNAKAFVVLFLTFWYLVVNDGGATPSLDFGGFFARQRAIVAVSYASAAIVTIVLTHLFDRWRRERV